MKVNSIGSITISETDVTYSGWGNLTKEQKEIIQMWAINRLRSDHSLHHKAVNHASFLNYTPTE
jgi:hypothetical protein